MLVVAIVLVVGVFKGLDLYTHHGEEVIVPDVKGMMPSEADKILRDRGLLAKVVSTSYQKEMRSGCILDITPEQGEKVKKGRIIFLTINSINAPLQEVPDVTENSSAREAEAQLLTAGFHLTPNTLVNGELDWVYGVLYNGRHILTGEKIPVGSMLTLQIGNGNVAPPPSESDSMLLDENVETGNQEVASPSPTIESKAKDTEKSKSKMKPATQPTANKSTHQTERKNISKKEHKNENSDSWF